MKQHIKTVKELTVFGIYREALDEVVKAAERYELLRTLSQSEFEKLCLKCLDRFGWFDNEVDKMIDARK